MKSQINWFPELLPEEQILMNSWIDISKNKFDSYWYVPLETSVVENMDVLLSKWSDDKELYWVSRHLNIQEEDVDKNTKIWLHFDLTIPFARYVSSHFNDSFFSFQKISNSKMLEMRKATTWKIQRIFTSRCWCCMKRKTSTSFWCRSSRNCYKDSKFYYTKPIWDAF